MTQKLPHGSQCSLALADGRRWVIVAGNEEAASVVSRMTGAMQLRVADSSDSPRDHNVARHLRVLVDARQQESSPPVSCVPVPAEDNGCAVCVLAPREPGIHGLFAQLVQLSLVIACDAQTRGGVLIHGALAERNGAGIVLAAPSGTGKTTSSNRLPLPWNSLCDDTTLVVRDSSGNYWAHPWPTWSRFVDGGAGGSWFVENAVRLKGIFCLSRALEDRVEPVGPGRAVSLLVECVKQVSQSMARGLSKEGTRALHLEWFNNLSALACAVPAHVLHISLTGPFWQEIERALEMRSN